MHHFRVHLDLFLLQVAINCKNWGIMTYFLSPERFIKCEWKLIFKPITDGQVYELKENSYNFEHTRTWLIIIYEEIFVEECSWDCQQWEAFFRLIWQINQCSRSYQILKCCASTKWSSRWSLLIRRNLILAVYGWFVNSLHRSCPLWWHMRHNRYEQKW